MALISEAVIGLKTTTCTITLLPNDFLFSYQARLHQVLHLYEGFLTAGIQEQKVKFQNILQKENVIIRETNWAYRDSIKLFRFIR